MVSILNTFPLLDSSRTLVWPPDPATGTLTRTTMHQPDTTPRASLYFPYRVHEAAPARPSDAPVVVVGAGPIGLVTALGLAQQGVRCAVMEAECQVSEGSRAIAFTRRSLEILQHAGAADAVMAKGLPWTDGNSYYRGQRVFRMEMPWSPDDRYPPLTNLQQPWLEQFLLDAVARQPLIEMRWGHKLDRLLSNGPDGAELAFDTPTGGYRQPAAWVVAADGARSALRAACARKMEGAAYEGRFVIADIRIDLPLPTERLAFFDPDWNRGNTVLMHREPDALWRIDYQLPPGADADAALQPAALKAAIDAQLAMIGHAGLPWELDWCSVYSARALTLPDYVHGRIAFVGDAAHLLPIFGVRGANTGFQDAQNLAWKLGLVARGLAPPALLASYSHERVAAAREIVDEAGKSTRFMTPPTRGFRLLRDAVLSLSLRNEFVRPLFHWRTSRPHDYRDSPLNAVDDDDAVFGSGPVDGAPVPNLKLAAHGDDAVDVDGHLLDHLCHGGFTLLSAVPLPALDAMRAAWAARGVVVQALARPEAARLGLDAPGAALLVRPDQHVCARWREATPQRLNAALARALAGATPC
jgi:3-(3-hydroxy-phenyl)propionate hydroxylase